MPAGRRHIGTLVRDVGRLIAPLDILYQLGNLVYKRSLRYTAVTAGISLLGLISKSLNLPGFTARQALLLPLLIGATALLSGLALRVIPTLIASRLLVAAQAADLNLMEDYRKAQAETHLQALWRRLFLPECRLRLSAGQPGLRGMEPPADPSDPAAVEAAGETFLARCRQALATPLPQARQLEQFGLDLRFLEDWRDGAYLDRSDSKLTEQYNGSSALLAARRAVGLTGLGALRRFGLRPTAQKLWFAFLTRMIAIQTAATVQKLNDAYRCDLFNSQVLLWPGEEDDPWLGELDGARQEVLAARADLLKRVFGPSPQSARRVLNHLLYTGYAQATELRLRFDVEYALGEIGYSAADDLQREAQNRRDRQCGEAYVRWLAPLDSAFCAELQARRPELAEPPGAIRRRAARIAFAANLHDLRKLALGRERSPSLVGPAAEALDAALADAERIARMLASVRMHHELNRLARQGYWTLIADLAASALPSDSADALADADETAGDDDNAPAGQAAGPAGHDAHPLVTSAPAGERPAC